MQTPVMHEKGTRVVAEAVMCAIQTYGPDTHPSTTEKPSKCRKHHIAGQCQNPTQQRQMELCSGPLMVRRR